MHLIFECVLETQAGCKEICYLMGLPMQGPSMPVLRLERIAYIPTRCQCETKALINLAKNNGYPSFFNS